MDGASVPQHRTATPPPPVLVPGNRVGRFRSFFSSSSSHHNSSEPLPAPIPQRKRSVRFFNEDGGPQLDGPFEHAAKNSTQSPQEASHSSWSQRLSDQMENIGGKINGNGPATNGIDTIIHRPLSKQRPTLPYMNANSAPATPRTAEADALSLSPSTVSSFSPSAKYANSSPASTNTASTAATSWTSPGSNGSRYRHTKDECQYQSKSVSAGAEENTLPPIQEDSGKYFMIPVQEAAIAANPSITTVENVAAAKVYFETHFHKLLMESPTPRSLRRKRFEHRMADLGFSHDDRMAARQK